MNFHNKKTTGLFPVVIYVFVRYLVVFFGYYFHILLFALFALLVLGVRQYFVCVRFFKEVYLLHSVPTRYKQTGKLGGFYNCLVEVVPDVSQFDGTSWARFGVCGDCYLVPSVQRPRRTPKPLSAGKVLAPPKGAVPHNPNAFVGHNDVFCVFPKPQLLRRYIYQKKHRYAQKYVCNNPRHYIVVVFH